MNFSELPENGLEEWEDSDEYIDLDDEVEEGDINTEEYLSPENTPLGSSLKRYLDEIGKIPLLTEKEEKELAERIAAGDTEAKNDLIKANLRLVANAAKRYRSCGENDMLDLIQEGNLGLIRAAGKFDLSKGCRFSTYAVLWINSFMGKAFSKQKRAVHYPLKYVAAVKNVKKYKYHFYQMNERYPTVKELAEHFNLSEKKARELADADIDPFSLDDQIVPGEDDRFIDTLPDENAVDPAEACDRLDVHELVLKALDALTEKERNVLIMRYGLDGNQPMTLEAIGKKRHITKECVRQAEVRAISKLRSNPGTMRLFSGLYY